MSDDAMPDMCRVLLTLAGHPNPIVNLASALANPPELVLDNDAGGWALFALERATWQGMGKDGKMARMGKRGERGGLRGCVVAW